MERSKNTFIKEIEAIVRKKMEERKFVYDKKRRSFIKKNPGSSYGISYQTTVSEGPKSAVGFHFDCALYLDDVSDILGGLSEAYNETATLYGKMRMYTRAVMNNGDYYFDWAKNYQKKIDELFKDVAEFTAFADRIKSIADLSTERLRTMPHVRKIFMQGLDGDYSYCIPAVAVLAHARNGDLEEGLRIAYASLDNKMKIASGKNVSAKDASRFEDDVVFTRKLIDYIQ